MKLINLDDALVAIASTNGSKGDMLWALYDLPNVDPRPKGKWIYTHGDYFSVRCGVCGFANQCEDNFCPKCGADMRGDDHETD